MTTTKVNDTPVKYLISGQLPGGGAVTMWNMMNRDRGGMNRLRIGELAHRAK